MTPAPQITGELVEQFARGNGVVFAGAGLSSGAGLPRIEEIMRDLAGELDGCPAEADYRDIAQYYEIEYGRHRLVQRLRDRFDTSSVEPGMLHREVARLPASVIFTSSYDDLLEQAFRTERRRFVLLASGPDVAFGGPDRIQLVRLYGDLAQPESIVVTARDRERFSLTHSTSSHLIELILQTRTVLFIGYAPEDPDLRLLLNQVRKDQSHDARNLYSIHVDASALQVKELENRGVKVISLRREGRYSQPAALSAWLGEFNRHLAAHAPPAVPARARQPVSHPRLAGQVVGLLEAMGYAISNTQSDASATNFLIEKRSEGVQIRRHIRCVDGRITSGDVRLMAEKIENEPGIDAWLITYRRGIVTPQARLDSERYSRIQIFSVAEFYRTMLNLDSYLRRVLETYEGGPIKQYWVDLACEVPQHGRSDAITFKTDTFEGVETFLDAWIDTPGRNHVSILGDFGMGKTWLCQHYAATLAKRYLADCEHNRVPIFLSLRNLLGSPNLRELITNTLVNEYAINLPGGYRTFDFLNRHDSLVLIFDGFDEMQVELDARKAEENFEELAKVVIPDANCKVILTCRTSYFRTDIEERGFLAGEGIQRIRLRDRPNFEILYLRPLDTARIKQVLQRRVPDDWERYYQQIQETYDLPDLAQRPILLSMISATLPRLLEISHVSPASLYQTYTDGWVKKNISEQRTFMNAERKAYFMQELAWEMWQRQTLAIHYTEVPKRVRDYFSVNDEAVDYFEHDVRTQTFLERDARGFYSFAHKSFMEFFIAQKIFATIVEGDSSVLADAQTSHETDQFIKDFLIQSPQYIQPLVSWMRESERPLLAVNSAGILAKIGDPEITDQVIRTLLDDQKVRHLYLTAVLFRVLEIQWESAERLAEEVTGTAQPSLLGLPAAQLPKVVEKFCVEARNPRDGVARWFGVTLLAQVRDVAPEKVDEALTQALADEQTPTTIGLIQTVLAGRGSET